ncbi:hypothetical protein D3C80_794820 [compost metagenome]
MCDLVIRKLKRGFHAGQQRGVFLHCALVGQRHIQRDRRRRLNGRSIASAFGNDNLRTGRIVGRGGGVVTELSRLFTQRLHFWRLFFDAEHSLQLGIFLRKFKARHH